MNHFLKKVLICGTALTFAMPPAHSKAAEQDYYEEDYRSQFHFTPEASWMNDPNGMVYYKGEYHLFYQNNPFDTRWGPMHWGHAVSKDLVHWEHLPIALSPDENGAIFSGSAVIDYNNTAGFGKEAMVAIFTHEGAKQVQSLAYSNDKGRTWKKYEGNPVMPDPPMRDWRDPKVFWHESSEKWVMTLAAKNSVMIYSSPNLKEWTYESTFGPDPGSLQVTSLDRDGTAISPQTGSDFVYEGTVSVRAKNNRIGSGGLMFRADAEGKNGYSAEVDKSSGKLLLKRFTNDRSEVVKEISLTPIQIKADSIKLKVKAEGQKLWVYANGEPLLEVEDSFYGNGYFGLRNQLGVSVFRDMSFSNTSDFQTNITGWQAKSGKWEKSLDGVKAAASGRSIYLSNEKGSRFGYKTDMKMNTKGIGGLLFRADKEGKNGYYAELDGGRKRLQLIKLNNGKRTVMNVRNVPLEKESNTLEVRADGVQLNVLLNGQKVMEQNDSSFADGYFGLVSTGPNTSFQNVRKELNAGDVPAEIENPDFEKGSLEGWVPMEGNAFANAQVTRADTYWGGTFDHQGSYHMWGAAEIGDDPQGSMRSSYFKLGGSGEINFLIGGGNDRENLHVSLMRASDNQELIRAHNSKWAEDEKYRRVEWDASNYLGETVYIKVTDKKSGGWGHINVDDFHVFNEGPLPENPDNDPGELPVLPYEPKTSGKLTEWNTLEGEWAEGTEGSYGGIWECPELIQVPVEGSPAKKKWVMIVSINDGAPAGGSGVQYFTGDFDGKTFTNENPPEKALWADYGADFYAAVSWNNSPGENPIWLGWMSNWQYANDTPTAPWKSAMTVPREMVMTDTEEGYRLKQKPVDQFEDLRLEKIKFENELVVPGQNLLKNTSGDTAEIETEFSVKDAKEAGLKIRSGNGQYTKIGYDAQNKTVFIDRTHSGYDFGPNVEKIHEVSVNEKDGKIKLRILLDRSSIEVFVNDGEQVMTDQIFAAPENQGMELYSLDGSTELSYLNVYDVKRIWGSSPFRSNLSNWKAVNGQWGDTISGKLGRSGPDSFNISGDRGSNFTYSAKIKVLNEGAGALVFRADRNARNGYAVNVDTKHDLIKLMKISNGSISVLQETPYDLNPNQVYDVKVTAKGNELKAYIDGALKISSTDQQFQEGYAGLNVWNATAVFNEVMLQAE